MKRFLLLMACAALVLLLPMDAKACGTMCESVFGPCTDSTPDTSCVWLGNCVDNLCRSGTPDAIELLTSKYQIASVQIEYRNLADSRENEIRVAAKTNPEPVKKQSLE
jgi:hypothetical protein